jgi:hypothetical protein
MQGSIITDRVHLPSLAPKRSVHRQNRSQDPVGHVVRLPLRTNHQNTCGIASGQQRAIHSVHSSLTMCPPTTLRPSHHSSLQLFQLEHLMYHVDRHHRKLCLPLLRVGPLLLSGYLLAIRRSNQALLVINRKRYRLQSILATTPLVLGHQCHDLRIVHLQIA